MILILIPQKEVVVSTADLLQQEAPSMRFEPRTFYGTIK